MEKLLRYALYPFLLAMVLAVSTAAITLKWDYGKVYGVVTLVLVLGLIAVERTYPLEPRWSMTRNSFLRDLKFIAAGVPTIALTKMAFGLWMISYSQHHTPLLKGTSLALEVTAYLLAFEFFQFWYHRGSHPLGGGFGRLLLCGSAGGEAEREGECEDRSEHGRTFRKMWRGGSDYDYGTRRRVRRKPPDFRGLSQCS